MGRISREKREGSHNQNILHKNSVFNKRSTFKTTFFFLFFSLNLLFLKYLYQILLYMLD